MTKKSEEIRYSPKVLNEEWSRKNNKNIVVSKEKQPKKPIQKQKIQIVEYYD
jgi:hypothetical protein